jgi:hypothetical protein
VGAIGDRRSRPSRGVRERETQIIMELTGRLIRIAQNGVPMVGAPQDRCLAGAARASRLTSWHRRHPLRRCRGSIRRNARFGDPGLLQDDFEDFSQDRFIKSFRGEPFDVQRIDPAVRRGSAPLRSTVPSGPQQ